MATTAPLLLRPCQPRLLLLLLLPVLLLLLLLLLMLLLLPATSVPAAAAPLPHDAVLVMWQARWVDHGAQARHGLLLLLLPEAPGAVEARLLPGGCLRTRVAISNDRRRRVEGVEVGQLLLLLLKLRAYRGTRHPGKGEAPEILLLQLLLLPHGHLLLLQLLLLLGRQHQPLGCLDVCGRVGSPSRSPITHHGHTTWQLLWYRAGTGRIGHVLLLLLLWDWHRYVSHLAVREQGRHVGHLLLLPLQLLLLLLLALHGWHVGHGRGGRVGGGA